MIKENLIKKTPVIVVLGHVDHGKTSILDYIRKTRIAQKETGGITQHIGAYQIKKNDKKITFLDTPGHEAFLTLRERGAKVADIGLLVIDATEGPKSQTKEAIFYLKSFRLPFIVVLNKIDKPEAQPEKVKIELTKENVFVESLGGKIPCVEVSAKTGEGIDELLELIELVAEMEDLKADIEKEGEGVIIEAFLDPKRGPTATLILENGVLKKGDILGTLSTFGKIRILEDFQGNPIEKALPGDPAIVVGFEEVPMVGEKFKVFDSIEKAKNQIKKPKEVLVQETPTSPDKKTLNLIIKADVLGSLEAILEVLKKIPQDKIAFKILRKEIGEINESDIKLAKTANAQILAFRVKPDSIAKKIIEREKMKILKIDVIYELVEKLRKLMEKLEEKEILREDLGELEVLAIFFTEKNRQIVGGRVIEGKIEKGAKIEIFRQGELVGKGKLVNLKRGKNEVDEVEKGKECGILYEGEGKIQEGDILKFYILKRE